MGVTAIPTPAGGGIKSVQRGLAGGAGTITITSVDISKSFVTIYGTTSSGVVSGTGTKNAWSGATGVGYLGAANTSGLTFANVGNTSGNSLVQLARNFNANATSIGGGSTNLVTAVIQGYLSNSTSLVVSGACRWEVVEFA